MQILKIKEWIQNKPHFVRDTSICIIRIKDFCPFFLTDFVRFDDAEGIIVDFMDDNIRVLVQVGNPKDILFNDCIPLIEAVDVDCIELVRNNLKDQDKIPEINLELKSAKIKTEVIKLKL